MKLLASVFWIALWVSHAKARFVFAHFMVGNVPDWSQGDWEADIQIAQDAKIDAFALNMAESDRDLDLSLDKAFAAANAQGFKLFFSFDYAAGNTPGGSWSNATTVANLINKWQYDDAYWRYAAKGNKAFVSTFEGPSQASDWDGEQGIKALTGCYFIPNYSSLGAYGAMQTRVPDGLFSWAAWPWGNDDMNTIVDESYRYFLDGREYMMPVSPWFFTNLPGYNKNWLWRGDDLWWDRWRDVMVMKPAFVQIISWNDWGESHYIGPLSEGTFGAFDDGKASYNYAREMPHNGWRQFLPFLIDSYKEGKGTVSNEGLVIWSRKHPKASCTDGGTTGNTASQLQYEFSPLEVVQDKVFFSALLGHAGNSTWVSVTIGGAALVGHFSNKPDGGVGLYHGSVATNGLTGPVTATLRRDGRSLASVSGPLFTITDTCEKNIQNWNTWVGSDEGTAITPPRVPELSIDQQGCIQGTGKAEFRKMCEFTCKYDYCPAPCHCLKIGKRLTQPESTGKVGYPMEGRGSAWLGLCSFSCNLDSKYCAAPFCSLVSHPLVEPALSPFQDFFCQAGTSKTGTGSDVGICEKACEFGYCPIHICKCTSTGPLHFADFTTPDSKCRPNELNKDDRDYQNMCGFLGPRGLCEDPCIDPGNVQDRTPVVERRMKYRATEY